jgi:hypothetical protein
MTKRELVARLTREPIVVEQVAKLAQYRISLHDAPERNASVWLGLARVTGTLLVEDYACVYARINGRVVRLTYRETEAVVSRLRKVLARGSVPTRTDVLSRHEEVGDADGHCQLPQVRW